MIPHGLHDFAAACLGLWLGWFLIRKLFRQRLTLRTADLLLVCVAAGIAFSHNEYVVGFMAICGIVTRCLLGIQDGDSAFSFKVKKDGAQT